MKPIKIECPKCKSKLSVEPESKDGYEFLGQQVLEIELRKDKKIQSILVVDLKKKNVDLVYSQNKKGKWDKNNIHLVVGGEFIVLAEELESEEC